MTTDEKTPKQQKLEANAAAKARLIAEHETRFHELLREEYRERGVEFPQTPEEKHLEALQKLLEAQPDLLVLAAEKGVVGAQHGVLHVPPGGGKQVSVAPNPNVSVSPRGPIEDTPLPDPDAEIHRVVQQFASEPNDGIEDDAELPPDHDVTPPNENPVDPFARTEP